MLRSRLFAATHKRFIQKCTHCFRRWISHTNSEATKLLKALYSANSHSKHAGHDKLMRQALAIYNSVNEDKNHYVINTFLRACLQFKHPEHAMSLWHDVKDFHRVSHSLVLKCCVAAPRFDQAKLDQCLQILRHMQQVKYIDKSRKTDQVDYSVAISSLITLCSDDIHKLRRVHSLVDDDGDIFLKTALIQGYGACRDAETALDIFGDIFKKDTVSINATMTVLNDNEWFRNSLQIYGEFEALQNQTSHLLALQACAHLCDLEQGQRIHNTHIDLQRMSDAKARLKFATTLVDLYGNCLAMHKVRGICDALRDGDKDVVFLSAVMEAYSHNSCNVECLQLFGNLRRINASVHADRVCYAIALKACTQATALHLGRAIHRELAESEHLRHMLSETDWKLQERDR